MTPIIDYNILKFTGKVGYSTAVNSVSFKTVDTATFLDDNDSRNYPIYAPYLTDKSLSYETWTKFKLNLSDEYRDNLTSRGLIVEKKDCGFHYNITYTKIKNICFWFNTAPINAVKINVGVTDKYTRPTNTESDIAVEDVLTYYNPDDCFSELIKFPIYFNGKNEILITQLDGAISDDFYVWQLQVLKGLKYQLDQRLAGFKFHYELE